MLHHRIFGSNDTGFRVGTLWDTGALIGSTGLATCPGPLLLAIRAAEPYPCCLSISTQWIADYAPRFPHNDNDGGHDVQA